MKRGILILAGVLLLFAALAASYLFSQTYQFKGSILSSPIKAPQIMLRSVKGPVRLDDFQGKVVLLYFGYTSCPDVCPTAMADIKLALASLTPEEAAQVQVIFISVDPARDTPETLGRYVKLFQDNFIGATGTREEIDWMTDAFGVTYSIEPPDENGAYSVSHSAFTMALDRDGYYVMSWAHGAPSADIGEDLRHLLKEGIPVSAKILAGPTYTPVVCAVTLAPAHVQSGQWLYEHHCAQCHGLDLAGNPQWQTELADGSHLAPPLDGSGNAWKISRNDIFATIQNGRNLDKPIHMPAFKSKLADWEMEFIFAYIQSKWDINELNYQHGFMTLTPAPTKTPAAPIAPFSTVTPSP
ncbi:MAG: SCO family protein [Anaerolineales bacterium]|nr:SCO family protein [Anaerolineales bacterium]